MLDNAENHPVQFLIAGKAHPARTASGKELIKRQIDFCHFARESGHSNRVVFVENYDINGSRATW